MFLAIQPEKWASESESVPKFGDECQNFHKNPLHTKDLVIWA